MPEGWWGSGQPPQPPVPPAGSGAAQPGEGGSQTPVGEGSGDASVELWGLRRAGDTAPVLPHAGCEAAWGHLPGDTRGPRALHTPVGWEQAWSPQHPQHRRPPSRSCPPRSSRCRGALGSPLAPVPPCPVRGGAGRPGPAPPPARAQPAKRGGGARSRGTQRSPARNPTEPRGHRAPAGGLRERGKVGQRGRWGWSRVPSIRRSCCCLLYP